MTTKAVEKANKALAVEIIQAETRMIQIPPGMDYDEAITWLKRKRDEDNREVAIRRIINAHPFDAAYCLGIAAKRMFGFGDLRSPTWFEKMYEGKPPPHIISVPKNAQGDTAPVMWGDIQFPGIDGYITTTIAVVRDKFVLVVAGEIRRKHERIISELLDLTEEIIDSESLYRGKAVRVEFIPPSECNDITDLAPVFMNLTGIDRTSVIFSADTGDAIMTNLFTPIMHTDMCRAAHVPIKRGVLLVGKYGTGKTLTANVTAWLCEQHGWTFVYAKSVKQLPAAIEFAKRYQPSVVFAEDLDEVVTKGRDREINAMLNTIDGIDNKTNEVMVVLTTNHVDRINPAMLRPSRLDAVIVVEPPDAHAAVSLVERYGGELLDDSDMTEVGRKLAGHIPAVIQEVVERSKLGAIAHGNDKISAQDLLGAAQTMTRQIELIEPEILDDREPIERAADSIADALRGKPRTNGQTKRYTPRDTEREEIPF